jgi:hypothetical protein
VGEVAVNINNGKFPHPLTPSRKGRGDFIDNCLNQTGLYRIYCNLKYRRVCLP